MKKIKAAIVGTGPAGLGVLKGLTKYLKNIDIDIYEIGKKHTENKFKHLENEDSEIFYNEIYSIIKKKHKFKFPPPKTHFGEKLPKYLLHGKEKLFKSQIWGGLSNYWGGGILPFSESEFKSWPISRKDLDPYYKSLSEIIPISGRKDELNRYYGYDFVNREPLSLIGPINKLNDSINSNKSLGDYNIISGISREALETNTDANNSCTVCGECLCGCYKNSIYNTKDSVEKIISDYQLSVIIGKVIKFDPKSMALYYKTSEEKVYSQKYDKIYIAAGCPSTTEIVMRSLDISQPLTLNDNAVFAFPVLYFGKKDKNWDVKKYLSICNLIWGLIPKRNGLDFAQASVYPNFDYLWRFNTPNYVWKRIKYLSEYGRNRIFWVRLFVHGNSSQTYTARFEKDNIIFDYGRKADKSIIRKMLPSLKKAINKNGFYMPPFKPILQSVNSHYSSSLKYGGGIMGNNILGEIVPNVHICDSSWFPDLPAVSLTFTIMANASRIADKSLALTLEG